MFYFSKFKFLANNTVANKVTEKTAGSEGRILLRRETEPINRIMLKSMDFLIDLILPAALCLGVD
jgi:hypothetical protein